MKYNTIQRLALYEMLNGYPSRVEVIDYNEKRWLAFDGAFACAFEPKELKIIPPKSEGENAEVIGEYITDDEPSNYLYKTYKQVHYDGRLAVEFKTRDNETIWIDNKYLSLIDTESTILVLHPKAPSITIYNRYEESGAVGIVFPLKKEWAEKVETLREMRGKDMIKLSDKEYQAHIDAEDMLHSAIESEADNTALQSILDKILDSIIEFNDEGEDGRLQ